MVLITDAQFYILSQPEEDKKHPEARGCAYPDLIHVETPRSAIIEKVQVGDKKVENVTWEAVELPVGFELKGVMDHGNTWFTNVGPDRMKTETKDADGKKVTASAECGERVFAFFEGVFFCLNIPKTDTRAASVHYFFDRQTLSHFCLKHCIPIPVAGADQPILCISVEEKFQKAKASLTKDEVVLQTATDSVSAGKLKQYMSRAPGVPAEWLDLSKGENSLALQTLNHCEHWGATCPKFHAFLRKLVQDAVEKDVDPSNVFFYEHNEDKNYSTGLDYRVIRPFFEEEFLENGFKLPGKNFAGIAITRVARKVYELDHEAYVAWFKDNFPPLFELEQDTTTTLGARTASQAELPLPAAGRTLSS